MTYRMAGGGEPLIHPRLERSHNRRRPFPAQFQHGFQRRRLITARDFLSRRALIFRSTACEGGLDGALSIDDLLRGIRTGLGGTALSADDQQRASALMKEAYTAWAGTNKAAADESLGKGAPNAPAAAPGDHVTVLYRGRLIGGTEFDSPYRRGKPLIIRPNDVIAAPTSRPVAATASAMPRVSGQPRDTRLERSAAQDAAGSEVAAVRAAPPSAMALIRHRRFRRERC
jgi:hypothetical protein